MIDPCLIYSILMTCATIVTAGVASALRRENRRLGHELAAAKLQCDLLLADIATLAPIPELHPVPSSRSLP